MLRYIVFLIGFFMLEGEVTAQQLQLMAFEDSHGSSIITIPQLAGRKARIVQDLPNVSLAVWGDNRENFLFGEKDRSVFGSAKFASFDGRIHYLNYGFFYGNFNEYIRFIPLPTGHRCRGHWLQFGNVRGVFIFYNGLYRFGSYCLDTGTIAFLDRNGRPMVVKSTSEAAPPPHDHSPFYQICVGKNKRPVTLPPPNPIAQSIQINPLPSNTPSDSINADCVNGLDCFGDSRLILIPGVPGAKSDSQAQKFDRIGGARNAPIQPDQGQNRLSEPNYGQISNQISSDHLSLSYAEIPPNYWQNDERNGQDAYNQPDVPHFDPISNDTCGLDLIRFVVFIGFVSLLRSITMTF